MTLHPKRDSETTSFTEIVSRALGTRPAKRPDNPAPTLHETIANLDQSERANALDYSIDRIKFAETPSTQLEAHRQRLQHLLENARQIEQMLAQEAAQARALSENLKLDEKRAAVAEAVEAERRASAEALAFVKNGETAAAYHAKIDAEVVAAQRELAAAEASVSQLQTRLRDAQDLVVASKSKVIECQAQSKEAEKRSKLAKDLVHDAQCRVAQCREAREAAELAVRQAEEIAGTIALTAETLKRIRELGRGGTE